MIVAFIVSISPIPLSQVCRALELPLSSHVFREVLTRLAESACDQNEDMQV